MTRTLSLPSLNGSGLEQDGWCLQWDAGGVAAVGFKVLTVPLPEPGSVHLQMAKGGKLKSVLKKWQSFSKLGRTDSSSIAVANHSSDDDTESSVSCGKISHDLHPVYVGKSRRRYLISSNIVDHPLFRELVEKSGNKESISVGCEVVLFEHLLWMIENADPQPDSLDELVEFYSC
ncbi:hypothetical protein F0562_029819 [Nyssa sinensis]|uniref:Uncharacterized protein n=1 Tax=Nyssa sinensis TaxID=561372 RepID=A0A5J5AWC7_9ASTE|nr:hypothetical protein F0562_029819 [Nyssa sinensis]